ncbi:MAG: hypothetical protein Q9166_000170 [cf. Caloplaca sp. 2 TL-2023]
MFGVEFREGVLAELQKLIIKRKDFFSTIPQELGSHILSFISPNLQGLKNARLVSHSWAETAAPFLFSELWLTLWTLDRLEDEQSIQGIRPRVRKLVVDNIKALCGPKAIEMSKQRTAQIANAIRSLRDEILGNVRNSTVGPQFQSASQPAGDVLFKRLVSVDIELLHECQASEQKTTFRHIGKCLSAADGLQDTHLGMDEISCWNYGPVVDSISVFADFLTDVTLTTRKLKNLQLRRVYTTASSIQSLLMQHRMTLKSLEIDNVWLPDESLSCYQDGLSRVVQRLANNLHVD